MCEEILNSPFYTHNLRSIRVLSREICRLNPSRLNRFSSIDGIKCYSAIYLCYPTVKIHIIMDLDGKTKDDNSVTLKSW